MRGILLLMLLAGCRGPSTGYRLAEVPVAAPCPDPPPLPWPRTPLQDLTAASTPSEVARAYAQAILILKGRLAQALALLNGYRSQTPLTEIPE